MTSVTTNASYTRAILHINLCFGDAMFITYNQTKNGEMRKGRKIRLLRGQNWWSGRSKNANFETETGNG